MVLPNALWTAKFFRNRLNSAEKRLWLKDVELELCTSDLPLDEKKDWYQSKSLNLPIGMYPSTMLIWALMGFEDHDLAKEPHDVWKQDISCFGGKKTLA